jgi:hypothetical protein
MGWRLEEAHGPTARRTTLKEGTVSILTKWLEGIGVPKQLLDYGQKIINEFKGKLAAQLPSAQEILDSAKRQAAFKKVYNPLPASVKAQIDPVLLALCEAGLVKIRKVLGI